MFQVSSQRKTIKFASRSRVTLARPASTAVRCSEVVLHSQLT